MGWMSIFIVVFREAFEIALTLVLVLVGTQGLVHRSRWIMLGFTLGVVGSVVVGLCTGAISEAMEGMGQEFFRATILAVSALLIGYTVIWMQKHGAELAQNIKKTSGEVLSGKIPAYALTTIIGLTVLRDGAEVVLLSQGFFVAGAATLPLIVGGLLGLLAGSLLGGAMYFGLVKVNAKIVFQITSVMLIFVAAGLASQAIGYLSAAGMLTSFATPLWDMSHVLSEESMIGEFLHMLFGYTSRPTLAQVVCYFGLSLLLFVGWYRAARPKTRQLVTM